MNYLFGAVLFMSICSSVFAEPLPKSVFNCVDKNNEHFATIDHTKGLAFAIAYFSEKSVVGYFLRERRLNSWFPNGKGLIPKNNLPIPCGYVDYVSKSNLECFLGYTGDYRITFNLADTHNEPYYESNNFIRGELSIEMRGHSMSRYISCRSK